VASLIRGTGNELTITDSKGNENMLYMAIDNNPAIIDKDTFEKVQQMRLDRSNIVFDPNGRRMRKETHYSSKVKREKND